MTPDALSLSLTLTDPWVGPKPIRLRIMEAIGQRLSRISIANGYLTDSAATVWYGRLVDPEPASLPMLNYWDGHEDARKDAFGSVVKTVTVTVEMYDKFDSDDPATSLPFVANRMLADAERAMMFDLTDALDPTLGDLAESLTYVASDLVFGVRPELWVGMVSEWQVSYRNPLGQPNDRN